MNNILVIGLGYVGLPVAISLSRHYNVFGYDKSAKRIDDLKEGKDYNKELSKNEILKSKVEFYKNENQIKKDINHV